MFARELGQCVGIGPANAAMVLLDVCFGPVRMAPVGSADAGARRGDGAGLALMAVSRIFHDDYSRKGAR